MFTLLFGQGETAEHEGCLEKEKVNWVSLQQRFQISE